MTLAITAAILALTIVLGALAWAWASEGAFWELVHDACGYVVIYATLAASLLAGLAGTYLAAKARSFALAALCLMGAAAAAAVLWYLFGDDPPQEPTPKG